MEQKKKTTKTLTFTEEQVVCAVAEAISQTAEKLGDMSLIIAGILTMSNLRKILHRK